MNECYEEAWMEVVEFETMDVVTTSDAYEDWTEELLPPKPDYDVFVELG